ncbi:MAG: trigger factor [Flavobacteriales bacterium]|nr:trigger factor [Flavobacteriales bacterium]MCB9165915.1 trigger factor [Flavobacteriales bacterium]
MNIEKEETGTLTATLKLTLSPADYDPGVESALKEQRRKANWPGFRPGQVPMSIVRKRIGRSVLLNEVERLIGESLNGYIQQNDLRVLGQPLPRDTDGTNDWDAHGEFTFAYEMGLAPRFDVELDKNAGITLPVVDVSDELVDREVADMRRRFGDLADVEVGGDKDMLLGDMIELDADGAIKEGGILQRATISLEYLKDEATRQALTGRKVGDEVRVDPHKVSQDHDDLARMLGVTHAQVHDLNGEFLFRVAEIKHMNEAPLDQTLFDRVYGKDAVSDEAGFRERVRTGLEGMFRRDSERVFKRLVMKHLLERTGIELPDGFLKRWIMETSKDPVTAEEVEQAYSSYAEGLRRQLLEDGILEKYGLEAKNEEIQAFAQRYVADQFGQYGMPAPEGDELARVAGRLLSDRDQVKRMRDSIVDQKIMRHFITLLEPKEQRMGYEEFVNLARTS